MLLNFKIFVFLCGFVIGVLLYLLLFIAKKELHLELDHVFKIDIDRIQYEEWLKENGITIEKANIDELHFGENRNELMKTLEAQVLYDLIHLTCVVFVEKQKNAYFVDSTWGPRCNDIIYYSTIEDNNVNTIVIPFINGWQFFCDSLRHLWANKKTIQWVLFSEDDLYVIPDNVRYFVAAKDFNEPYYFGHKVEYLKQIFNSGSTSYLLSYGAVKALVDKFIDCTSACRALQDGTVDYILGKQLAELGIHAGETRDYRGRERFHIFNMCELMGEETTATMRRRSKYSVYPITLGLNCCSDTSISFKKSNIHFNFIHYLFNHLRVFKTGNAGNRKQNISEDDEMWKVFLKDLLEVSGNIPNNVSAYRYELAWYDFLWYPRSFNKRKKSNYYIS